MHLFSGFCRAAPLFLFAAAAPFLFAVETHVWEQSDQAEFARGAVKHLSLRSDGHITLAPEFKELDSTNVPYLWTIAQDSKGDLYYAGGAPTGATTRIYELPHNGKPKALSEIAGLEIHALAVDSHDRVYAAVLPDAKIYRIDANGKPQLFFDPKCKYIWAMAFNRAGDLFVATGDAGLIYRVTPDGKGSKFADTGETHARSMIVDEAGNLIVGTEPSGLVLRIAPTGESFVLYETGKREVTAVAEHDGIIYASSIGSKAVAPSVTGPAPILPSNPAPVAPNGTPRAGTNPPMLAPPIGSLSASVGGGSDLYRIQKDGFAERVWSSPSDLIYAIAFDASGKPLVGTGNKGLIYRIDSDQLSTQLLNAPPTQVTAFLQGRNGMVYAVTGNVGNVYSIGPGMEMKGTLESTVHDAADFAYWGKAHLTDALHGGTITLETRSGNLSNPEMNWSPWSKVNVTALGGQIQSPPARFLQYRLTLECGTQNDSPVLSLIDLAYLPKNIAPRVNAIEIAPFNYRESAGLNIERTVMPSGSPVTITVQAVGQRRPSSGTPSGEGSGNATLQYSKGYVTIRWSASDVNADSLSYRVELRGKNDRLWRTLKDKLQEHYYSFDSAAFPDGEYVARITASDAPGNTPADALSSSLESDPFTIDNTPPEVTVLSTTKDGSTGTLRFTAKDALSWIDKAEYSIDGGDWTLLAPANKVTDSRELSYALPYETGHLLAVRVFDENDNVVVRQFPPQ